MTISSTNRKAGPYVGNDSATAFPFSFKVFSVNDVQVIRTDLSSVESTLVINTDYTVALNSDQNANPGGTVNMLIAPVTGSRITITSSLDYLQPTDLTNNGGFYPKVITNALDRLTIFVQQLAERLGRSLSLPISAGGNVSTTLPVPLANRVIAWNETATGLQSLDPQSLATIVAFGTAGADVFTGDGSTKNFTLSASPGALNNLDVSLGGQTLLPGIDYTWAGGTTLTTVIAPGVGSKLLVRYMQGLPQGVGDAAATAFLQSGSGAVSRDAQTKLREFVSVKDFGAVGNGVADDTLAFSYAVSSLSSGGILFMPPGTYKITSGLTISKPIRIIGSASNASVIAPYGNFDIFTFNGGTMGAGLKDLSISAAGMTGGNCVAVNTADRTAFENLIITNPFNGFDIRKANVCSIRQVWMNSVRGSYGIQWYGTTSVRSDVLDLDNVVMSCSSNTVGATGLLIDGNVNTLDARHVACTNMGRGLWVKNSSGGSNPAFITAYDFQCDFPLNEAVRLEGSARSIFLTDFYAHGSTQSDGIYIDSTVQNVHLKGGQVDAHYQRGVFAGGRYIRVSSCNISNNSAAGSALWAGLEIGGSSIGVNAVGNLVGQWVGYAANNQSYGVLVDAGAQAYMVTGCNLRNNVSGDYQDNASDSTSVIFGNNTASSTHGLIDSPVRAISGDLLLYGSGTNSVKLGNATNGTAFAAQASSANSVNFPKAYGVPAGSAPSLEAVGSDTNIDLRIAAKGTGVLQVGNSASFAANGSVATAMTSVGPTGSRTTVQKWLTIKDQSGNPFYIPCF